MSDRQIPNSALPGSYIHAGRDIYIAGRDQVFNFPPEPVVVPRQLPPDATHFTGRVAHLAKLDTLLPQQDGGAAIAVVISAIGGTAGVGKTALAVHWARGVRDHFPDGDLYVNLRGYDPSPPVTPGEALDGFLRALNVSPERIPAGLEARAGLYRSLLHRRRVLVLLDNAATAEQVRPLLPGSPGCLVVVTSRSDLSGLVTRDGAERFTVHPLTPAEAIALLRPIIGNARVDDDLDAAIELARLCVYLPLTLRIAAERVATRPQTTLARLAEEIGVERDRLDLFATPDDDATTAIRSVFSWSYRALSPDAARLFRLLSLHGGLDISIQASAALTDTTTRRVRRPLEALTSVHLLEEMAGRYRFHDLLRVYAAERAEIDESEEDRGNAVRRVLAWYLHTADAARGIIFPQPSRFSLTPLEGTCTPLAFTTRSRALAWCETERANLVAATRQAFESGQYATAWKLPATLWGFFILRKPWIDWISTYEIGLAAAKHLGDRYGEIFTLSGLGLAYFDLRRLDEAFDHYQRALAISRADDDSYAQAAILHNLGIAYRGLRRFDEALDCYEQALAIRSEINDRHGEGTTLNNLGEAYCDLRRFDDALDCYRRALAISREFDDYWGEGNNLSALGEVYQGLRRFDDALDCYRRALAIRHDIGDRYGEAVTLHNLGEALHDTDQLDSARDSWRQALAIFEDLGDPKAAELRVRLKTLDADTSR